MNMKEQYLQARITKGMSNEEIAKVYGVKLKTVTNAIGSYKKYLKGVQSKMEKEFEFVEEVEAVEAVQEENEVIEPIYCNCIDCGEEFVITPVEIKFYRRLGYAMPKRCESCRKKKKVVHKFRCIDCGADFTMNESEIEFYNKNNLFIPVRCKQCREFKKERNNK